MLFSLLKIRSWGLTLLGCAFLGLLSVPSTARSQPSDSFPFAFPHDVVEGTNTVTNFSYLNRTPAGDDGFVRIAEGHFTTDAGRLRIWGVNFCFGANFPTHEESERVARRLASLGINCVRIHHHETALSPKGLYQEDGEMDPAQVDKLDYLLDQLHKRGIYANLNLHVGRSVTKSLGLPPLGEGYATHGDKHSLHFMPAIQNEFWKYCREYIGHVNPYRKLSRGKDPGIAMIELLNENRFSRDGARHLRNAPAVYQTEIQRQWNAWLAKRYVNDLALRDAWKPIATKKMVPQAESAEMNPSTTGVTGGGWNVADNGGKSPIASSVKAGIVRLVPTQLATLAWQQQLGYEGLSFAKGETYTLKFDIRADAPRKISLNTSSIQSGWHQLGLGGQVAATPEWKSIVKVFKANEEVAGHGRLGFDVGGSKIPLEIRNVQLLRGAHWDPLPQGQGIADGNVAIPEVTWVPEANRDFIAFMMDTERSMYQKTTRILRDELGVVVPICGTQTNYVGVKLASEIGDYTDMHSYWNHPLFIGRNWNAKNWTVGNESIAAGPYSNEWPRNSPLMRAAWRVHGMPFTYSEWNTGEPGFASAGGIPIMGLIGALQDWDGIFFFDFEDQGERWDEDSMAGFFRINGQPCKLALLAACGKMFREGDLQALTEVMKSTEGDHFNDCLHVFSKLVGMAPELEPVMGKSTPNPVEFSKEHPPEFVSPDGTASWDATDPEKAAITINTNETKAAWGLVGGQTFELGDWKLMFGSVTRDYAVMMATSRDGKPLFNTSSALISVVNHVENEGMAWNEDRTSVGTKWGHGPTQTWGVPLVIEVPQVPGHRLAVFAVNGSGERGLAVPVTSTTDGKLQFELGPLYKTLLYEYGWTAE